MKLKTLSKINIYSRYVDGLISKVIDRFLIVGFFTAFMSLVLGPICLINNISEDAFLFFIINMIFNLGVLLSFLTIILGIGHWFLKHLFIKGSYNQINIDVSDFNKMILMNIVNKKYKFDKLKFELKKLETSFTNQSTIYYGLNNEDFPYINKLLRRMVALDKKQKELSSFAEAESDKQDVLINPINLEKLQLRLSDNPKLLTLDLVDNELNNLIFHQMNVLKQEKV